MTDNGPLSPQACADILGGLSAQTMERLETYVCLLAKWQKAINLVGPKTLADPWRRHILDSAQVAAICGSDASVADLGSGAGLPGLIVALMTDAQVTLIESDQRKATFLREAARETGATVNVQNARIEDIPAIAADVVTVRALAPLPKLLPWVARHLKKDGKAVLLKGSEAEQELTLVAKNWTMDIERRESLSEPSATVLILSNLAPRDVC